MKILAFSDLHLARARAAEIVAASAGADLVIGAGDFCNMRQGLPEAMAGVRIQTRLNGETMQDANTSDLIFPVRRIMAILSEIMTLHPGDVVVTGTPEGVGHARRPPVWMKAGDKVEVEIDGLGILKNTVEDEK